jgi:hypothetical protein
VANEAHEANKAFEVDKAQAHETKDANVSIEAN